MDFFAPLTEDRIVEPDGPRELPSPMIPGLSQQRAVLYRRDDLVVAAYRFEVVPEGFHFTIQLEGRGFGHGRFHFIFTPGPGWPPEDPIDENLYDEVDDMFRLGLSFSDRTTSEYLVESDRDGPTIETAGCTGSPGSVEGRFWIPELPPPGEFTLHITWPSAGIEETSTTFNADEIRERAKEAELLLSH